MRDVIERMGDDLSGRFFLVLKDLLLQRFSFFVNLLLVLQRQRLLRSEFGRSVDDTCSKDI